MIEYPLLKMDEKYGTPDADADVFLTNFNIPAPAKVLVVGDNEENVANILTDNGYDVTGVDLRELPEGTFCNHKRIIGDFCDLELEMNSYDVIICLSALEHFGLSAYGDKKYLPNHDIAAMYYMWRLVKSGGSVFVTVPFGTGYMELRGDWRVYSTVAVKSRIIQKFNTSQYVCFTSGPCAINGEFRPARAYVSMEEATEYCGDPPHVTLFLAMNKPTEVKNVSQN
ncbi:class I SAM-dependent methyltransferase [Candidatus Parcubacteria bacterium]|nr:MAG: class I SAM-dependent methyltransferase [Candidatus Parcubacteria bacterium]